MGEHEAVTNFRKYLRIPSVHPNVNYDECVTFLTNLAKELQLPSKVIEVCVGKPIVIITVKGLNPELPTLLLNSHMDVVPVFRENWNYDPFEAFKDANGDIYARGAQDMKCVGIQYIETIRKYLKEGLKFKRTIHLTFVPDEEIGGIDGMYAFIHQSPEFKELNVGFALDEGMANPNEEFFVYYAERAIWQMIITCGGNAGHGSVLHDNTAGEKIRYIVDKFMDYREKEKSRLLSDPKLALGDVTTVNLTYLKGGVQLNVVPPELEVGFDLRLAVDVDHDEFIAMIESWCKEAGKDVRYKFKVKNAKGLPTSLDESNPWWMAFKSEIDKMGLKILPTVFPGGTDSRFLREIEIPAIGFSPINNTPRLLHDHDEFLNEGVFLRGLDIYYNIIKSLASV